MNAFGRSFGRTDDVLVLSERPPPLSMRMESAGSVDGSVDVVVIGGGVNGTGVARDLSLRGLRVALFERNDLAFGASGNSSGMIHGGVRYLLANPNVTRASCQDSGYIRKIAPQLLFRIPFLMPMKAGPGGRIMLELMEAYFRAYDAFQPLKRGEPHTRLTPEEVSRLEPGLVASLAGCVTFDEWGVDGGRLVTLNAVDAKEHGAKIFVHTTVERIGKSGDRDYPYLVTVKERLDGSVARYRAKKVVNATGAWGPITAALGGLHTTKVRLRPGKGIHIVFDRRLCNYAIATEAIDGRQIFLEPWQNTTIVGTTDDDYYGDLDNVVATSEEVRYLVQGIARIFPTIRGARAIGTYAGVRPTLYEYGKDEDSLSREHAIVDHAEDGVPGVYSMIGGKLASYRLFAEEMSDKIASDLAPHTRSTTHEKPLPGGDSVPDACACSEKWETTPVSARRLVFRHGSRALGMLEQLGRTENDREIVCACEPVLACEIRHVVRNEFARTVDDVARRTRLGYGACGGMRCAVRCAQIVADETDVSPKVALAQATEFLTRQARTRVSALGPDQIRQEALLYEYVRANLNLGKIP